MTLFKRLMAASVLATTVLVTPAFAAGANSASSTPIYTESTTKSPTLQLPDFTSVIEKTQDAVVNIRVRGPRPSAQNPFSGFFGPGNPFDDFPGFFFPKSQKPKADKNKGPYVDLGEGSGFIISADGYIVTANHVIRDAKEIVVTMDGGKEYKAKVIGADERSDTALLKIDAKNLPFLKIGDSKNLKKGQWVLAIGSPFGLDSTATAGIVSAINRDTGDYLPFIQTDVAINPGNSGGPLINLAGDVVGMNTQIVSPNGGFAGISLSIPIDQVIHVVDQLKKYGHVVRGYLGVRIADLTPDVAKALKLTVNGGALIANVEEHSPASRAGIKNGDVVLSVNGEMVKHASDLPRMIGFMKPGTKAKVQVWRLGKTVDLTVTIGKAPNAPSEGRIQNDVQDDGQASGYVDKRLGATFANISASNLEDLGVSNGVRVVAVSDDGYNAGLREGDVLVAFNQQAIHSVKELKKAEKNVKKGDTIALQIRRGNITIWFVTQSQ